MAYVPHFANDIFISYAHIDNRAGWVDQFNTNLENRLVQLDANCSIWRDDKLNGTDVFSDVIFNQLKNSALLVTIITPRGLRSNWCQDERQKFEQAAELNGGFRVGESLRAIKVTKTPLEDDAHREIFGTLGFEFYQRDPRTNRFREFDFTSAEFRAKIDDLAQEIKRILDELRTGGRTDEKPGIYIAETTADLAPQRDALVQQAEDWGYQVNPHGDLPEESIAYRDAVTAALAHSVLSIHLFSDKRGTILDGEEISIIPLQYELANTRGLDRIAWIRPEAQPHPSVASVLGADTQDGLALLEGRTMEELKEEIESRLKRLKGQGDLAGQANKRNIYLVCGRGDLTKIIQTSKPEQVLELKNYLEAKGFVVWLPPVNVADERLRRKDHREMLKISDAAVLYWGDSDEAWFRENLRELNKARTVRNSRRSLTIGAYISPPPLNEKTLYRNHLDVFVEQTGDFRPEIVVPLLKSLNAS